MIKRTLWISVVLVVFAVSPGRASAEEHTKPRQITVSGTAEIRVMPNEVVVQFEIQVMAKTLAAAKTDHDGRASRAISAAKELGIEARDIQTGRMMMGPDYEEIKDRQVLVGYEVSQEVNVRLRDLSKYEVLLERILQAGVTKIDSVQFLSSEVTKHRAEARLMAVRAAREKATAMANELGQKLGPPLEITEGGKERMYPPNLNSNATLFSVGFAEPRETISPGETVVVASVVVTFQLQ